MTNIDTILKTAAPEALRPDRTVVDADLARGRAAMAVAQRRRTYRRLSAGAGASLALAAVVVIAATSGGGAHNLTTSQPGAGSSVQANSGSHAAHAGGPTIKLVDYTGAQLAGFTVSQVPQGWHLSTSTPYALLITPDGSTDNRPDVFVGKLAVLTSSTDQQGFGSGDAVTVNGKPGVVSHQGGELLLNYNAPNGFGVNIQAPDSLGWTESQIVAFAEGITVTAHAVHSVG